jgi:hypothetical protein
MHRGSYALVCTHRFYMQFSMCSLMVCARARTWCIYYSYVLCKMPKRPYKHVCAQYWVWQPQRIIILVLR